MLTLFLGASGFATSSFLAAPPVEADALALELRNRRGVPSRCAPPIAELEDLERSDLALVLREIESLRDWVGTDVAAAAMRAVEEKRSLDAFILALQDEVQELSDQISTDIDILEANIDEQSEAFANAERAAIAVRLCYEFVNGLELGCSK